MAKLTHDEAAKRLTAAGITWSSSGNCSDKENKKCTSFEQINSESIDGIIWLKDVSCCEIHITGAAETGHAKLPKENHYNGYKIDIRPLQPINDYIKATFKKVANRKSDNSEQWVDENDNYYAYEKSPAHWDITFFNAPKPIPAAGQRIRWVWSSGEIVYMPNGPGPTSIFSARPSFDVFPKQLWQERPLAIVRTDGQYWFRETERNDVYIELTDDSRDVSLRLHRCHGQIRNGKAGAWVPWHGGSWK